MARLKIAGCAMILSLMVASCTSLPDVENRLQTLQFHPNMYVVQAGDTLETVAFRYRLDVQQLTSLNPGVGRGLEPGMRLNVQPGTELLASVRNGARNTVVNESPSNARRIATHQNTNARQPVIVSGTESQPVIIAERVYGNDAVNIVENVDQSYTEVRASTRTSDPLANNRNDYPLEEIIPDTLDFEPVRSDHELLAGNSRASRWAWPTDGQIARGFAPDKPGGQGVDIAGVPGQDVRAANDGTVVYSGRDLSGGGNLVIVRHDGDLMTTYSHAHSLYVAEDDVVRAGDPIASLGWNANQESVLRFEVRKDGNPLNPMEFLPAN